MRVAQPLRPWIWCLVWLGILLLAGEWLRVDYRNQLGQLDLPSDNNPVAFAQALDEFLARDCFRILALGDSILRFTTQGTADSVLGEGTCLLTFAPDRGRWSDFLWLTDLEPGKHRPIEVVLVHDNLFVNRELAYDPIAMRVAQFEQRPHAEQLRLAVGSAVRGWIGDAIAPIDETREAGQALDPQALRREIADARRYDSALPLNEQARSLLTHVAQISSRPTVIHLPKSTQIAGTPSEERWLDLLPEELATLGVEFWVVGQPMAPTFYADGEHVTFLGREKRLEVLRRRVAAMLRDVAPKMAKDT